MEISSAAESAHIIHLFSVVWVPTFGIRVEAASVLSVLAAIKVNGSTCALPSNYLLRKRPVE